MDKKPKFTSQEYVEMFSRNVHVRELAIEMIYKASDFRPALSSGQVATAAAVALGILIQNIEENGGPETFRHALHTVVNFDFTLGMRNDDGTITETRVLPEDEDGEGHA